MINTTHIGSHPVRAYVAGILALTMCFGAISIATDSLYVGDGGDLLSAPSTKNGDNTIETGAFRGIFVKSQGGMHLPNGIIIDGTGGLFVVNQNVNTGVAGEILEYSPTKTSSLNLA